MVRRQACLLLLCGLTAVVGCSSDKTAVALQGNERVQKKVDLMNRIADAVAKDPKSNDTLVAIDEFCNLAFDPQAHPDAAKSIIDTYDKQVRGKLKGDTAQQLQTAVDQLRVKK